MSHSQGIVLFGYVFDFGGQGVPVRVPMEEMGDTPPHASVYGDLAYTLKTNWPIFLSQKNKAEIEAEYLAQKEGVEHVK